MQVRLMWLQVKSGGEESRCSRKDIHYLYFRGWFFKGTRPNEDKRNIQSASRILPVSSLRRHDSQKPWVEWGEAGVPFSQIPPCPPEEPILGFQPGNAICKEAAQFCALGSVVPFSIL